MKYQNHLIQYGQVCGNGVNIMTRALEETVDKLYEEVQSIRAEQSDINSKFGRLETHMEWIRESIAEVNNGLKNCQICRNSKDIIDRLDKNDTEIKVARETGNSIKWTATGISIGVSIIITILAFIFSI